MSEMKHTPGPWTYGDWITGKHGDSGNSGWVEVWNIEADGSEGLPFIACKHHDQVANARLIAAAPELLEASIKVLEWFEAEDDHSKADFYQRMQMCRDAEEMIRAAIAKATGGQP